MAEISSAAWRWMAASDLAGVERVGEAVHPDYPEDAAVLAERLRLYPAGCLVLEGNGDIQGYVIAHPWLFGCPPPLNTLLDRLPTQPDTFYIHDLALAPTVRGGGFGGQAVERLVRQARSASFGTLSLVAVGSSPGFWRRNGFEATGTEATRAALATYGGAVFMVRVLPC